VVIVQGGNAWNQWGGEKTDGIESTDDAFLTTLRGELR